MAKEENNKLTKTYSGGFKRPLPPKTYDRIFNADQEMKKGKIRRNNKAYRDCIGNMFDEQGKIMRMPIITEKPCNDNYKVMSTEAKNNLTERYYYEMNTDQW